MSEPTEIHDNSPPIPMPPHVREEVVALLAQILVADYQLFHGAPRPTDGAPPQQRGEL